MIPLIVGILLIFFFFFVVYKSAATWRALHLTALGLTFLVAVVFLVLASLMLKTHGAWVQVHGELTAQLAAERKTHDELLYGDLTQVRQDVASIQSLTASLSRAVIDRGRVWRECSRSNVDVDQTTGMVTTISLGAAAPTGIQPNTIVYAFGEKEIPLGGESGGEEEAAPTVGVPEIFLGEFKVADATENTITLTPTVPLDNDLRSKVLAGDGAWTLYEQMPLDSHLAFAAGPPDDEHLFGPASQDPPFEVMDEEKLRQWMPNPIKLPNGQSQRWLAAGDYDQLVAALAAANANLADQYARDGQRAGNDDPPENVWIKVKFLKKYEVDVDMPQRAEGENLPSSSPPFDPLGSGRAVVDNLRRGDSGPAEPAVFQPNDIGYIQEDYEAREGEPLYRQLIRDGVCEETFERIFVRPLNDYQFAYHDSFRGRMQLNEDIRTSQRDTATIQDADAKCKQQIAARQKEQQLLQDDVDHFKTEVQQVTQYAETLANSLADARSRLSQLYQATLLLHGELVTAQKDLADQINRRSAEAGEQEAPGA